MPITRTPQSDTISHLPSSTENTTNSSLNQLPSPKVNTHIKKNKILKSIPMYSPGLRIPTGSWLSVRINGH